jgi:hypothetical protein
LWDFINGHLVISKDTPDQNKNGADVTEAQSVDNLVASVNR